MWSKDFGATISGQINKRTTHVIAARHRRTAKVRQAARYPKIKIVGVDWLHECFVQWKQVDETPYLIHTDANQHISPQELADGSLLEDVEDAEDVNLSSEEENIDTPLGDSDDNMEEQPNSVEKDLEALEPKSPMVERSLIGGTDQDWRNMHDEMEEWLAESGSSGDSEDDSSTDGDDDGDDDDDDNVDNGNNKKSDRKDNNNTATDDGGSSSSRSRRRKRKRIPPGTASANSTDAEESDGSAGLSSMSGRGLDKSDKHKHNHKNNNTNNTNNSNDTNDMSKLQKRKRRALQRVSSLNKVTSAEHQAPSSLSTLPSHPATAPDGGKTGILNRGDVNGHNNHGIGDATVNSSTESITGATGKIPPSGTDANHIIKGVKNDEAEKEKKEEEAEAEAEDADLEAEMEAELSREDL